MHLPTKYIRYNCCRQKATYLKHIDIWKRKKIRDSPSDINFKHSKPVNDKPLRILTPNGAQQILKGSRFFWVWFGLIKNEEENEKYLFE